MRARVVDHRQRFGLALDAVDRLLDALVEVLDADAHAVETQFAEQLDGGPIDLARVDLDRVLAAIDQAEMPARRRHQLTHLVVRKKVGVPPPQCNCATSRSSSARKLRCSAISLARYFKYLADRP